MGMLDDGTRGALEAQQFGGPYARRATDGTVAAALKDGLLRLSPHPDFALPAEIDWRADPFGDRNWRAQFHMLRWLDPLRRVALEGDDDAAALWWSVVQSWARDCLEPEGAPVEAWMDMVDGMRAIELALGLLAVERHAPDVTGTLLGLVERHGEWLADHTHRGRSNHALHQLQGLLLCGLALGRGDWVGQATAELAELFADEYDEEGVNREGAIAYHHNNYTWWRDAIARLRLATDDVPEVFGLLEAVPEELAHATQPDGTFVSIGNSLGGSPRGIAHPATQYVTSEGRAGEPPEDLVRVYRAGYIFGRSGWGENERDFSEETFYSVVFGAHRKVHGHTDSGSITWFANKVPWVVDPGKFSYDDSADRIHFMERASHNVVSLEGRVLDRTRSVELVRSTIHPNAHDFLLRDPGYDSAVITRRIVYSVTGEYLVVVDTVRSDEPVSAIQSWQLSAETEPAVTSRKVVELRSGTARAAIVSLGVLPEVTITRGEAEPLSGWVATGWRQKAAASRVALRKSGTAFRFITVLAAGFRDSELLVSGVRDLPPGVIGLDISTGRARERILLTEDGVMFPSTGASADELAETVQARRARARVPVTRATPYAEIRDAVAAAKAERWRGAGPEAATALGDLLDRMGDPVVDHGVRAAIADLTRRSAQDDGPAWRQGLVNWDASPGWAPTRYPYPVESRLDTDDYTLPAVPTILTLDLGHLTLPVAYLPGEGPVLTVLFHGAIDRGRTRLPMFQRISAQRGFGPGPILAFSDPTLDLSSALRLGWYLGTAEIDLPQVMARVVRAARAGSGAEHVLLQGGSGGGFAAIATAVHVPDAVAVAFNPQTDVRAYAPRFVRECLDAVFPEPAARPDPRLSLMARMDAATSVPRIELIVNTGDEFHRAKHSAPLVDHVAATGGDALAVTELNLGPGHRSPDNPTYARVMGAVHAKWFC